MRKAFYLLPLHEKTRLTHLWLRGAPMEVTSLRVRRFSFAWIFVQRCTMHEKNKKLNKKTRRIKLHSMTHACWNTKACQQIKIFREMTSLSAAFFRTQNVQRGTLSFVRPPPPQRHCSPENPKIIICNHEKILCH